MSAFLVQPNLAQPHVTNTYKHVSAAWQEPLFSLSHSSTHLAWKEWSQRRKRGAWAAVPRRGKTKGSRWFWSGWDLFLENMQGLGLVGKGFREIFWEKCAKAAQWFWLRSCRHWEVGSPWRLTLSINGTMWHFQEKQSGAAVKSSPIEKIVGSKANIQKKCAKKDRHATDFFCDFLTRHYFHF